MNREMWVLIR